MELRTDQIQQFCSWGDHSHSTEAGGLCNRPTAYCYCYICKNPFYNSGQLQLHLSLGCTNFLPTVTSIISVFLPCYLTLLSVDIHLSFIPYFQEKNPVHWSWPRALPMWLLTFGNCLLLCSCEVMFKKWPALLLPTMCNSIFLEDLTHWFPEQPEVCSHHVQKWGFSGTLLVNRDFKLYCFIVTVIKTAINLHFSHEIPLLTSRLKWESFQVTPLGLVS